MTGPRRARSITEASAPLEHYLIPVPATGQDVCSACRGPVTSNYVQCYRCHESSRALGSMGLDAVAVISLAPRQEQMGRDLTTYKHPNVPSHLRASRSLGLAAVVWRWLAVHERCIARTAGSAGFDLVTTVPSTRGRASTHPLTTVVGELVTDARQRARDLLTLSRADLGQRVLAQDRFVANADLQGHDVLVIDDTWTTGAKIQSAGAALKAAGAGTVAGLAIGRWINADYANNAAWLTDKRRFPWVWDECCLCRPERR